MEEGSTPAEAAGERWLSAEAASVFLGPILLAFQNYENENAALDKRRLVFALNDLGLVDGTIPPTMVLSPPHRSPRLCHHGRTNKP